MAPVHPPVLKNKLDALTGIRFFAALLVVCVHVGTGPLASVSTAAARVAMKGYAAVGLFYVLSGFVLAYNYRDRKFTSRSFLVARFARIYPVYFLALLLALPMWLMRTWQEHNVHDLLLSFATVPFLIQSWFPVTALLWNGPAWSLSAEAFFYCLFPFLLVWLGGASRRRLQLTLVLSVLTTISVSSIYLLAQPESWQALLNQPGQHWTVLEDTSALGVVNFNPLLRLPEFIAGIVLGILFLNRTSSAPSSSNSRIWDIVASLALLVTVGVMALPPFVPYPFMHNALLLPLWCVLVYSLAGSNLLCRVLGCRALLILGEISYGMYILQQPISGYVKLAMLKIAHIQSKGDYPNLALFLTYVAALTAISYLSFRFMETPARERIRRLFGKPTREKAFSETAVLASTGRTLRPSPENVPPY